MKKTKQNTALSQALLFKKSLYLIIRKFGDILRLIMSYVDIILKSVLTSLGKVEIGSMTFTYQG